MNTQSDASYCDFCFVFLSFDLLCARSFLHRYMSRIVLFEPVNYRLTEPWDFPKTSRKKTFFSCFFGSFVWTRLKSYVTENKMKLNYKKLLNWKIKHVNWAKWTNETGNSQTRETNALSMFTFSRKREKSRWTMNKMYTRNQSIEFGFELGFLNQITAIFAGFFYRPPLGYF